MINVSRVVNSPRLAQSYQIIRGVPPGSWLNGVYQGVTQTIEGFGVVTVAQSRDIEMIPEGDRVSGSMVFHSECAIYGTYGDATGKGALSDMIIWRGHKYRVLYVAPWADYGYYRATGVRIKAS